MGASRRRGPACLSERRSIRLCHPVRQGIRLEEVANEIRIFPAWRVHLGVTESEPGALLVHFNTCAVHNIFNYLTTYSEQIEFQPLDVAIQVVPRTREVETPHVCTGSSTANPMMLTRDEQRGQPARHLAGPAPERLPLNLGPGNTMVS